MANKLILKNGAGVPAPEKLEVAELALDTQDGSLYSKLNDGTVVQLNDASDSGGGDVDLSTYISTDPEINSGWNYFNGQYQKLEWTQDGGGTYHISIGQGYGAGGIGTNFAGLYCGSSAGHFEVNVYGVNTSGLNLNGSNNSHIRGYEAIEAKNTFRLTNFPEDDKNAFCIGAVQRDEWSETDLPDADVPMGRVIGSTGFTNEFNKALGTVIDGWGNISTSQKIQAADYLDAEGNSIIGSGGGGDALLKSESWEFSQSDPFDVTNWHFKDNDDGYEGTLKLSWHKKRFPEFNQYGRGNWFTSDVGIGLHCEKGDKYAAVTFGNFGWATFYATDKMVVNTPEFVLTKANSSGTTDESCAVKLKNDGPSIFNFPVQAADFLDAEGNSIVGSGGGGESLWTEDGPNITYSGGNVSINKTPENTTAALQVYKDASTVYATIESPQSKMFMGYSGGTNGIWSQGERGQAKDFEISAGDGPTCRFTANTRAVDFFGIARFSSTVQATDYLDAEGNSIIGAGGGGNDPRITDTQINNWDTAFSWGDHKGQGYLTSASLNGYATETWVTQNYQGKGNYSVDGHTHNYAPNSAGNGISITSGKIQMSGSYTGSFTATGDVTAYSDEALKKNITTAPCDVIERLRGVEFEWKEDGRFGSGVIAQEVEQILPHLIHDHEDGHKSVNYNGLIGYLIESVKSLRAELEEMRVDS